jgi:hypothetical protein
MALWHIVSAELSVLGDEAAEGGQLFAVAAGQLANVVHVVGAAKKADF